MRPVGLTDTARRAGFMLAAAVLCVYVATAGGSLTSVDAVMTYESTRSLVARGTTAFDRPGLNHHQGLDGRFYSPFGIGQSIYNIPFYLSARVAEQALGLRLGREDTVEKAGVALASTVAAAGTVWVVYLLAWRLGGRLDAAVITALACAFGTLLWPYSRFGFNQALTGWCLTAGVYAVWLGTRLDRRDLLAWGGTWLACAFLTRHEMAVPAALTAGWVVFESRRDARRLTSRLSWFGVPLAVALVFWLWFNAARFGSPFDTGNLGPADAADEQNFMLGRAVLSGAFGLLFSPGRSLFLYTPLTLTAPFALARLARRDRSLAGLLASVFAVMLLVYGSLRYWDGLRGYGPRYLVPLLPLLTVPLVSWLGPGQWRRPVLVLVFLSGLVQLPGVLVDYSKVSIEHARLVGEFSRDDKVYRFRDSALVLDARAALEAVPANARNLLSRSRPAAAALPTEEGDSSFAQRFSFSLDFWWLYLYYLGAVGPGVSIVLAAVPLSIAAVLFIRLWRVCRVAA